MERVKQEIHSQFSIKPRKKMYVKYSRCVEKIFP